MSDEDDYLSDKFLVDAAGSAQSKTYSQRRQESLRRSRVKNEQNRPKSRRQREQESREEGLSKSLFDGAKGDGKEGENKALGIMLKMGFKIGQSLGQEGSPRAAASVTSPRDSDEPAGQRDVSSDSTHRVEPLPLNAWSGKQGIGSGKRTRSPGVSDRLAKMAKMAEDASKEDFRDYNRREYEERHAEARLETAQRTCTTLDELAGVSFNVLWINPNDSDSIPRRLADALWEFTKGVSPVPCRRRDEATRLRDQMRADALQPVATSDEDDDAPNDHSDMTKATEQEEFPMETVEEAAYFFRLGSRDRLSLVLTYLRDRYAYCFWCGTRYEGDDDMKEHCPGPNEDDHD